MFKIVRYGDSVLLNDLGPNKSLIACHRIHKRKKSEIFGLWIMLLCRSIPFRFIVLIFSFICFNKKKHNAVSRGTSKQTLAIFVQCVELKLGEKKQVCLMIWKSFLPWHLIEGARLYWKWNEQSCDRIELTNGWYYQLDKDKSTDKYRKTYGKF